MILKRFFMEQSYKLDSLNINTMFTQIKLISKDSIYISNMNKWCIIHHGPWAVYVAYSGSGVFPF